MRVYLPGVAPTGGKGRAAASRGDGFRRSWSRAYEHIYWDQATLLVQVGLLDAALFPVAAAEKACGKVLEPRKSMRPSKG
jgi:carboxymethylenebutenolidase